MKTQKHKYSSPSLLKKRRERFLKQFTADSDDQISNRSPGPLTGAQELAVLTAGVLLLHGDVRTQLKTLRFLFGNNPIF